VSHSYRYLNIGFSAFPKITSFEAKQVLHYTTQKLQVINIGMCICIYILIYMHPEDKSSELF